GRWESLRIARLEFVVAGYRSVMQLDFWLDPACPWCWLTSRWVNDVAPHRDVEVNWRPISLMIKNETAPDSSFYEHVLKTKKLLRVFESVRSTEGGAPLGALYTVYGRHIHEQGDIDFTAATALTEAGLSTDHAAAFEDESWDAVIEAHMKEGLALVGDDVGTPILGFDSRSGQRVGFFGPVISKRLPLQESLDLWDGVMLMGGLDHFWELKRTRTEPPDVKPAA
ncbi:MAG: hypothetical protein JWN99_2116, partial [Ilumatobacteraceae bacterium]|nr:hypothetical protein [Ilumatobacteraceae bacterium]